MKDYIFLKSVIRLKCVLLLKVCSDRVLSVGTKLCCVELAYFGIKAEV